MTTLKITDSGAIKVIREMRLKISGGIHEEQGAEKHDRGPLTVVQVASANEFGGGNIPARLWLRGWTDSGPGVKNTVEAIRAALTAQVRTQKFEPGPFEAIARDVMQGIRGRILGGLIRPLNSPNTLARKAPEARPLVEHGQMAAAIHGRMQAPGQGWKSEAQ